MWKLNYYLHFFQWFNLILEVIGKIMGKGILSNEITMIPGNVKK